MRGIVFAIVTSSPNRVTPPTELPTTEYEDRHDAVREMSPDEAPGGVGMGVDRAEIKTRSRKRERTSTGDEPADDKRRKKD